ncbi:predicted protein, partial [Thalassiosira pseudonana CCMP1335]
SKKEDFRRYLEKSGAIDSLTSVLVGLYEESDRPLESTEYIKKFLGGQQQQQQQENDKLKKENDELKSRVHELNKTIETLRANLKTA